MIRPRLSQLAFCPRCEVITDDLNRETTARIALDWKLGKAQRRAAKLERILVKYAKAAWVKPEDVRLSRFQSYTHPIIKEYIAIQKRKKGGKS